MKKEMSVFALVLAVVFLFAYLFNLSPTGFAVFEQSSNLDQGVYENTLYDGSGVILNSSSNLTIGEYKSVVLDAGNVSIWNNLTWEGTVPGNSSLEFEVSSCSDASCSDASFTPITSVNNTLDLSGLNANSQFLQYKVLFSIDNINVSSPSLTGVVYSYSSVESSNETNQTNETVSTSVSLSEPSGSKEVVADLPLEFTKTGEGLTCWYSVFDASDDAVILDNTTLIDCNSTTFSLGAGEGDYYLVLFVNGTTGFDSSIISFTVDFPSPLDTETTSEETTTETPIESTVQVPVTTNTSPVVASVTQITSSEIASVTLVPGTVSDLSFSVQNTGTEPVSACVLRSLGDFASWLNVPEDSKNINQGDSATYAFTLNVPEDSEDGSYLLSVSADCAETAAARDFTVNVEKKKLGVEIISSERTRSNRVRVVYELSELTGESQDVQVYFALLDASNVEISNATENRTIKANETKDYSINLPVNESLGENVTLSLSGTFNSEVYESNVLEPINLGAPIGGFAVFDIGNVGTGSIAVFVGLIAVFLVLFFSVRRMRKSRNMKKKSSGGKDLLGSN